MAPNCEQMKWIGAPMVKHSMLAGDQAFIGAYFT